MGDKTSDLIALVEDTLPLSEFFRRSEKVRDPDKKLMADLGLSRSAYLNTLNEFEYELGVKIPDDIRTSYKFFPHTILRFLPPRRIWAYEVGDIPDMTINELAAIVERGYWPAEFFREAFPETASPH